MRVLLLYNPVAGNKGFPAQLDYIIDQFQKKDLYVMPYRLNDIDRLEQFLAGEDERQYNRIVIAGGDGTIHQVVNVLLKLGWDCPIALIPVGTANDFSHMFGSYKNMEGMIENALSDEVVFCDVGVANGKFFINVASFGNLIDISQKVNNQAKNILGVLAYYLKGLEEIPKLKPFEVTIVTEDTIYEETIYFALIMNGKSAGGFRKISPLSEINDGMLDVILFKKCPVFEFMPLLIMVWNGDHPESPYIEYFATNKMKIMCDESIYTDLDGEAGIEFPMNVEMHSKQLKIISKSE